MNSKPHVLFVAPRNNLYGACRSMLDLVFGLPERGVDVTVALQVPGPMGQSLDQHGVPWFPIRTHRWIGTPRGPLRLLRNRVLDAQTARRAAVVAREKGVNVVHTNTLSSPVGALIAKRASLPHIWHMREAADTDPGSNFLLGLDYSRRFIDETTRLVVCNSRFLMEETARYAARDKLRLVYSGVLNRADGERPLPPRKTIDPDNLRILMVGKISPRKGQKEAVEALALLRGEGLGARLSLAGDGEGDYSDKVRAHAASLGVLDAIDWLGYTNPKPLYADHDLAILCGPRDPIPRVAIESQAQEIPTVAVRSGGIPEVVLDGETGFLYEEGDAAGLAQNLERMIRLDPRDRSAMTEAGRRHAYAAFNLDRYRDDGVALYRELGLVA